MILRTPRSGIALVSRAVDPQRPPARIPKTCDRVAYVGEQQGSKGGKRACVRTTWKGA